VIRDKLDENPTLLVAAWVGAAVGAIVLMLRTNTDLTPIVDLVGSVSNAELVYLALGAAGVVSAAEDFGIVDREDFGS